MSKTVLLPTVDKGTQVKNEITGDTAAEAEFNLVDSAGLS